MANVVGLILVQGETRKELLTFTDTNGEPVALTDCNLFLIVRELDGTLVPTLTKQTNDGIAHAVQSGGTLGQATVTWDYDDTAEVAAGQYKYIAYVIDGFAERQVLIDWSPLEVIAGELELPPTV